MPHCYLRFCPCASSVAGLSVTPERAWRSHHFHNHFPTARIRPPPPPPPCSRHPFRRCEDSVSFSPLPRCSIRVCVWVCLWYRYTSNCSYQLVRQNTCSGFKGWKPHPSTITDKKMNFGKQRPSGLLYSLVYAMLTRVLRVLIGCIFVRGSIKLTFS